MEVPVGYSWHLLSINSTQDQEHPKQASIDAWRDGAPRGLSSRSVRRADLFPPKLRLPPQKTLKLIGEALLWEKSSAYSPLFSSLSVERRYFS